MALPNRTMTTPIGRLASLPRVLHSPGEPPDLITPPTHPAPARPTFDEMWEWR